MATAGFFDRTKLNAEVANLSAGITADPETLEDYLIQVADQSDANWSAFTSTIQSGTLAYIRSTANVTYFVNPSTGNDSNDGLSSGTALQTIQAAINKFPQIINHIMTINLVIGSYSGAFTLTGFMGSGSIIINGDNVVSDNFLVPQVEITGCSVTITINGVRAVSINTNYKISNCRDVSFFNCKADNSSTTHDGFEVASSQVTVSSCYIANKRSGIAALSRSTVFSNSNAGSSNTYGLICSDASKIGKSGSQPSGATAENTFNGGQIV